MQIAIASGKGGTGKTTVSVSLYYFLSEKYNNRVQLIDCDVEEPNDLLFFPHAKIETEKKVFTLVPELDNDKCTYCKKCVEWCEFNAISIVQRLKFAEVNYELCHSCGACFEACSFDALRQIENPLGSISNYRTTFGAGISEGRLEIGSAMQTELIKKVKKQADSEQQIPLLDAPPGTSCPVVETVATADYVILVTEPTPFGLHDLKITVELLKEINKPFGVIVNKANLGNDDVYLFLEENNIPLLGKIPFSKAYAENYSRGELFENIPEEVEKAYQSIIGKLASIIN
ncbi:ATP-binding protein [Draconibacterium sp. IB214405]|uniref:ATP-binding protein n=1 Tax=Draconibacterium sp. IB214405 TaxID=3097352 RepID=UPI002A0FBE0E|nr:ATP-binding protein [Draconibacterium sp. IB214405]MDX8339836.1 ATP-binding protein [Draconibacterium sp. IB214405]